MKKIMNDMKKMILVLAFFTSSGLLVVAQNATPSTVVKKDSVVIKTIVTTTEIVKDSVATKVVKDSTPMVIVSALQDTAARAVAIKLDTLKLDTLKLDTLKLVKDTVPQFEPPTPYAKPMNGKEYWYNMWSSPRFKKSTVQRDSLWLMAEQLKRDTAQLRHDTAYLKKDTTNKADTIRSLRAKNRAEQDKYSSLQKEHTTLRINSENTASKLTGTIDQKNKQLADREKQVNDMSVALAQREKEVNDMSVALAQREAKITDLENQLKRQDSLANALNNALKQALLNFASDDLKLEVKNGKVYVSLFDKLLFKSGRAEVEQAGKNALKKLADVLNVSKDIDIMVEGHTDSIPMRSERFPDNWELGAARALNIVRVLTQQYNVDPRIVISATHAEFSPLTTNATPAGRAKNRRTEIILTPRLDDLLKMINSKK